MSIPTTGLGWRHTRQQQTGGEVAKASQSKSSAWSTSGGGGGGSAKSTGSPVSVSVLSIDMVTCERKEATLFGGGGGGGVNSALTPVHARGRRVVAAICNRERRGGAGAERAGRRGRGEGSAGLVRVARRTEHARQARERA